MGRPGNELRLLVVCLYACTSNLTTSNLMATALNLSGFTNCSPIFASVIIIGVVLVTFGVLIVAVAVGIKCCLNHINKGAEQYVTFYDILKHAVWNSMTCRTLVTCWTVWHAEHYHMRNSMTCRTLSHAEQYDVHDKQYQMLNNMAWRTILCMKYWLIIDWCWRRLIYSGADLRKVSTMRTKWSVHIIVDGRPLFRGLCRVGLHCIHSPVTPTLEGFTVVVNSDNV